MAQTRPAPASEYVFVWTLAGVAIPQFVVCAAAGTVTHPGHTAQLQQPLGAAVIAPV